MGPMLATHPKNLVKIGVSHCQAVYSRVVSISGRTELKDSSAKTLRDSKVPKLGTQHVVKKLRGACSFLRVDSVDSTLPGLPGRHPGP